MFKKILTAILFLLYFSNPAKAAIVNPALKIYTLKTKHFYIHYPENISSVAEDVSVIAEQVFDKLSPKLNWKPHGRTHLVLSDQTDLANGMATVIPANYVFLNITPPDSGSSLGNYSNYLELLITHEFTHILHIDQYRGWATPFRWLFGKIIAPNGLTPGWMREGMATWEESFQTGRGRAHSSYSEMLVRTAILENKFPSIDVAAGTQISWPAAETQYIFGVKFWQWVAEKYGEKTISEYMKKYSSSMWLFSINNKAKKVYKKSFYKLWKEWQQDLKTKYATLRQEVEARGLTSMETFKKGEHEMYRLLTPHPSGIGQAYVRSSQHEEGGLVLDLKPGSKPVSLDRAVGGQLAFSRDSEASLLAYSSLAPIERYNFYSEVFIHDLKTKKPTRVFEKNQPKKSLRASDPDFAPFDGGKRWVLMVRTQAGTDNLYVYDRTTKKGYYLTDSPEYTQFSNPRFSPDGSKIAVSRQDHGGNRDIVLYDKTGQMIAKVVDDAAIDNNPAWSPDGQTLYFESDKTGISNIFAYHVSDRTTSQITNVLTGVFDPKPTADGSRLAVTTYDSQGYFIAWIKLGTPTRAATSTVSDPYLASLASKNQELLDEGEKQDSPLSATQLSLVSSESITPQDPSQNTQPGVMSDVAVDTISTSEKNDQPSHPVLNQDEALVADSPELGSTKIRIASKPFGSFKTANLFQSSFQGTKPINSSAGIEVDDTPISNTPSAGQDSGYDDLLSGKVPPAQKQSVLPGSKKYNAFPQVLVPRYLIPTFGTLDSAYVAGLATGRFDPLFRHSWSASANYRSDANFVGAAASYAYMRYFPSFYIGAARYALNWGDIFSTGEDFFEQRLQGYVGMGMAIPNHSLNLTYYYEDRQELSTIPAGFNLTNLDTYAGLRAQYIFSKHKQFPRSISQEDGAFFKLSFDVTDSMLGSAEVNEQKIVSGDFRYYYELPWADHHVLALRAAAGFAWGDPQFAGTFRFGGPFGEGSMSGSSDRLFPLRGLPGITFAGDRAMLFSGEYRLPLATVERGLGTLPIFLNRMHLAFFADYGDIWFRGGKDNVGFFDDFFLGVGSEVRADFVLGYGLPVTARLGYAVIVLNQEQIAGLTDSVTGASLDKGTVYFQFGTSF